MFELEKLNVHRIVATEKERDELIKMGFELVKPAKQAKEKADQKAGK